MLLKQQNYANNKKMFLKICFVLGVGILSVNSKPYSLTYNAEIDIEVSKELHNIIDDLVHLMEALEKIVVGAVEAALGSLADLLKKVADLAEDILKAFEEALAKAAEDLINEIFEIEKEAAEIGIDISECIGDSIDEINELPFNFLGNASSCVTSKVKQAEDLIYDSMAEVNATLTKIESLWEQVFECQDKNIFEQGICIAFLTSEITLALTEIPIEIGESVTKATIYVATLGPNLILCTAGQVAEFTKQGAEIVAEVTECAANKFSESTTFGPPTNPPETTEETTTTITSSIKEPATSLPTDPPITSTHIPYTTESPVTGINTTFW